MLPELGVCVGVVIIVAVITEVFRDLFRPAHGSALSDWIARHLFRLMRRVHLLPLAGPLALVTVIGSWVLFLVVGFALLYYPVYPDAFRTSTGGVPPSPPHVAPVLYFSFETLITLGYGDIVPSATAIRLISSFQALVGFGLLTASVSWLVLLYPPLSQMRLLARTVDHLVRASRRSGVPIAQSDRTLTGLARDVTAARIELVQFPLLYYFATNDAHASVAYWLPELVRLSQQGRSDAAPAHSRLAAAALDDALDDLARLLAEQFLDMQPDDRDAVFRALAREHSIQPAAGGA